METQAVKQKAGSWRESEGPVTLCVLQRQGLELGVQEGPHALCPLFWFGRD